MYLCAHNYSFQKLQTRAYAVCAVFGTIRSVTAGPGGDELLVNFVKIEAAVRAVLSVCVMGSYLF